MHDVPCMSPSMSLTAPELLKGMNWGGGQHGGPTAPCPPQLLAYLSRPGLGLLSLQPPGSALGLRRGVLLLLLQAADQLLDGWTGERGADFLLLLSGEPVGWAERFVEGVCRDVGSTQGGLG